MRHADHQRVLARRVGQDLCGAVSPQNQWQVENPEGPRCRDHRHETRPSRSFILVTHSTLHCQTPGNQVWSSCGVRNARRGLGRSQTTSFEEKLVNKTRVEAVCAQNLRRMFQISGVSTPVELIVRFCESIKLTVRLGSGLHRKTSFSPTIQTGCFCLCIDGNTKVVVGNISDGISTSAPVGDVPLSASALD